MHKVRTVITIDGLAASGKSSLAKLLAKRIGYICLTSGVLYRLIGLVVNQEGIDPNDELAVARVLSNHKISLDQAKDGTTIGNLDGKNVTSLLNPPEVSETTSMISKQAAVRKALLVLQRDAFPGQNMIAEGRDMGTVVFPDARLKFFVECEVGTRIDRRIKQFGDSTKLSSDELNLMRKKMEIEIVERDQRDSSRELSPTIPAPDSIKIINSGQTLTEVVESMYDFVAKRGLLS